MSHRSARRGRSPMFGAFGNEFPRSVSLHLYAPPPKNHAEWQGQRPRVPDSWLDEPLPG